MVLFFNESAPKTNDSYYWTKPHVTISLVLVSQGMLFRSNPKKKSWIRLPIIRQVHGCLEGSAKTLASRRLVILSYALLGGPSTAERHRMPTSLPPSLSLTLPLSLCFSLLSFHLCLFFHLTHFPLSIFFSPSTSTSPSLLPAHHRSSLHFTPSFLRKLTPPRPPPFSNTTITTPLHPEPLPS